MPEKALEEVRSPIATTAGLGSGVVLEWLYNDIIAPYFGLAEMPTTVVVVLSPLLVDLIRSLMTRKQIVEIPPSPVPSLDTIDYGVSRTSS